MHISMSMNFNSGPRNPFEQYYYYDKDNYDKVLRYIILQFAIAQPQKRLIIAHQYMKRKYEQPLHVQTKRISPCHYFCSQGTQSII